MNISSTTRKTFLKHVENWDDKIPLLTDSLIQTALCDDSLNRIKAFEKAYKEISLMLYQYLWIKFRTEEMARKMNAGNKSVKAEEMNVKGVQSKPAVLVKVESLI